MAVMRKRTLEPGEIRLGEPCPAGHIPYERIDENGQHETGVLERCGSGPPNPEAAGIIRMGEHVSADTRKIVSYTPFRAGPARVASDAYRSGWDAIFAAPRGKARKEKPN